MPQLKETIMGWCKEKYVKEYFLRRDASGNKLPYGVHGVEAWENGGIYGEAQEILDNIGLKDSTLLDIGFGRGEVLKYALEKGAKHVVGVDFSEAALELARYTLRGFPESKYKLILDDALNFLIHNETETRFLRICMFDSIEHIPRLEVEKMLPELYSRLLPGGALVIHTPFYPEDDDVLATGGKTVCKDSSDEFEATKGMHINRYSESGLNTQLKKHGFINWERYIYFKPIGNFPVCKYRGAGRRKLLRLFGYKIGARYAD